jgi:hypothetical protein
VANTSSSVTTDLSEVAAIARGSVKSCAAPPLISKLPLPPAIELLRVPQEKTTVPRTKGTTWKWRNWQDITKIEQELNQPDNYRPTS